MTRGAPHDDDEIPAVGGPGVFHKIQNQVGAGVPGGFVPESWHTTGERQVVVDGFGNLSDANFSSGYPGQRRAGTGGAILADQHKVMDTHAQ